MKKYILIALSIIVLFFWVTWESHAWTAVAEFELPMDSTDFTEVLVSRTQGNYSKAYGQRSALGESSVLIDSFELGEQYYLVARRLTAGGEYSNFSNEVGFIPALIDSGAGNILVSWEHTGGGNGFKIFIDEGHGEDMIWEGNDGEQRQAEIVCTLYGDQLADFRMLASCQHGLDSDYSEVFSAASGRAAKNVFQLLPWNARKRLCEGVQPSNKICFPCHKF